MKKIDTYYIVDKFGSVFTSVLSDVRNQDDSHLYFTSFRQAWTSEEARLRRKQPINAILIS